MSIKADFWCDQCGASFREIKRGYGYSLGSIRTGPANDDDDDGKLSPAEPLIDPLPASVHLCSFRCLAVFIAAGNPVTKHLPA